MKNIILILLLIVSSGSFAAEKSVYIEGDTQRVGVSLNALQGLALGTDGNPYNKTVQNYVNYAVNSTYGVEMNQNAALSDPVTLHDGTDSVAWTASTISGTWTFNSTAQAYTGTKSISGADTASGATMQIANGATSNVQAIHGHIYLDSWSVAGTRHVYISAWNTTSNAIVGNVVNIDDYIQTETLGVWQQFSIPAVDLGIESTSTINAVRISTLSPLPAQNFYLDDIVLYNTGDAIAFDVSAPADSILYIQKLCMTGVTTVNNFLVTGNVHNIPHDTFIGQSYAIGMQQQRIVGGVITTPVNFPDMHTWLQFCTISFHPLSYVNGSLFWRMEIGASGSEPIVLDGRQGDKIRFILTEDWSYHQKLRLTYSSARYIP